MKWPHPGNNAVPVFFLKARSVRQRMKERPSSKTATSMATQLEQGGAAALA
jgi:hypothetical protein